VRFSVILVTDRGWSVLTVRPLISIPLLKGVVGANIVVRPQTQAMPGSRCEPIAVIVDPRGGEDGKPASFWGLKGSASLRKKELVLTVVNPSVSEARVAEINIRGATVASGAVTLLSHSAGVRNTYQRRARPALCRIYPHVPDTDCSGN
jgi:hypothetical protein